MKRLLIGSNNRTKKLEKSKAYRVILKYTDAFSCYEMIGYWRGKREKCLVVELDNISNPTVEKMAKELAKVLKQEAIMIQDFKTSYKLIK